MFDPIEGCANENVGWMKTAPYMIGAEFYGAATAFGDLVRVLPSAALDGRLGDLGRSQICLSHTGYSSKSPIWRFYARSGRAVWKLLVQKHIDHAQSLVTVGDRFSCERLDNGRDG